MKRRISAIFKQSIRELSFSPYVVSFLFALSILISFYPSSKEFYAQERDKSTAEFVNFIEDKLRFANTAAQILMPIIAKDAVGFMQMLNMSITTTISTHSLKAVYGNMHTIGGVKLGERPKQPKSRHNMPSGHSSMASCAVGFIIRRYGVDSAPKKLFALLLILIMIATMYARVMLDMHTISATIAGAILGIINAIIFVSPQKAHDSHTRSDS